MATTLRNAAASAAGTSLVDADLAAQLLVTADGFFFGATNPVVLTAGQSQATIAGQVIGGTTSGGVGFEANGGNDTLSVQSSGLVSGETAVKIGATGRIVNSGMISGGSTGIASMGGNLAIGNHGTIRAATDAITFSADATQNTLNNTGKIIGNILGGAGADTINNFGIIQGKLSLGDGKNWVWNGVQGAILGSTELASANSSITNYGLMKGVKVVGGQLFGGWCTIDNHGRIDGTIDTSVSSDIKNAGSIEAITLSVSASTTYNAEGGSIGHITSKPGGWSSLYISNSGTIESLDFSKRTVGISYNGENGFVAVANLGSGRDGFTGGDRGERVTGGLGNDNVFLGAGNDTYLCSGGLDGNDYVEGGDGIDAFAGGGTTAKVFIDLAAEAAIGTSIGNDTIIGFENAFGTNYNDYLGGTEGSNQLMGADGNDTMNGKAGNDKLYGGEGADKIAGGAGADKIAGDRGGDQLAGGADRDTFIYNWLWDSTVAVAGRDVILDFDSGVDRIDLSAIDASRLTAGDQAFGFIGTGEFSGTAGELRATSIDGDTVIFGDTNGDKIANFAITVKGTLTLLSGDFVL